MVMSSSGSVPETKCEPVSDPSAAASTSSGNNEEGQEGTGADAHASPRQPEEDRPLHRGGTIRGVMGIEKLRETVKKLSIKSTAEERREFDEAGEQSLKEADEQSLLRKLIAKQQDNVAFAVVFQRIEEEEYRDLQHHKAPKEAGPEMVPDPTDPKEQANEKQQQEVFQRFVLDWCDKFYREVRGLTAPPGFRQPAPPLVQKQADLTMWSGCWWCCSCGGGELPQGFTKISVVDRTDQTADRLVVILQMDDEQIRKESAVLELARWKTSGRSRIKLRKGTAQGELIGELEPSAADRIFTMAHILSSPHRCGLGVLERLRGRRHRFDPWFLDSPEYRNADSKGQGDVDAAGDTTSTFINVFHTVEQQERLHKGKIAMRRPSGADPQQEMACTDIDPRIGAIFPLKDYRWVRDIQQKWWEEAGACRVCRRWHGTRDPHTESPGEEVPEPEAKMIDQIEQEYGAQSAFYFAFLSSYKTWTAPLAAVSLVTLLLGYWLEWLTYLKLLGVVGLLTASIWGPVLLGKWRQRSNELLHRWNFRNTDCATELRQHHPSYSKKAATNKTCICLVFLGGSIVLVLSCGLVILISFIMLEIDNALVTTPLCGSFFDRMEQQAKQGGILQSLVGIQCLESIDGFPNPFSDPFSDRGWLCILSGVVAGLVIDLIFTNLFIQLAHSFTKRSDHKWMNEEEVWLVRLLFPFEWVAFMAYFVLAAALVPFDAAISGQLYSIIGAVSAPFHYVWGNSTDHFDHEVDISTNLTSPAACQQRCQQHPRCDAFSYFSERQLVEDQDQNTRLHHCYLKAGYYTESGGVNAACMANPFVPWTSDDPYWISVSALATCPEDVNCLEEGHGLDFGRNPIGADGEPCGYAQLVGLVENKGAWQASAVQLLDYWDYNTRIYTTIDSLMIGPLIVAVWSGFVIRNLLPALIFQRLRWITAKRGRKREVSRCARALVALTCCFATPTGCTHQAELRECLKHERQGKSYAQFQQDLAKKIAARQPDTPIKLLKKPHELPGWSEDWAAVFDGGREEDGQPKPTSCCRRCCVSCESAEDATTLRKPANTLFVESELPIYSALEEYDELATQFSYVSTFTIVIPIGALMSFCRNLIEVHSDALHMFRDFRRPIPAIVDSKATIGEWETMFQIQIYLACTLTTAMFCFCTGHLEAFSLLLSNSTSIDEANGVGRSWLSCHPETIYEKVWEWGPQSECSYLEWDTEDVTYAFNAFMAPNLQCWQEKEHRAPAPSVPPCKWTQQDFARLDRGTHSNEVRGAKISPVHIPL